MTSLDLGTSGADELCETDGCNNFRAPFSASECAQHRQMRMEWIQERTRIAQENLIPKPTPTPKAPTGKAALICPHCQVQGQVKTRKTRRKQGISGGKATGAVLTLGLSTVLTGLSRKETVTEMRCGNCKTTWTV